DAVDAAVDGDAVGTFDVIVSCGATAHPVIRTTARILTLLDVVLVQAPPELRPLVLVAAVARHVDVEHGAARHGLGDRGPHDRSREVERSLGMWRARHQRARDTRGAT